MDNDVLLKYKEAMAEGHEMLKMGYIWLNLSYFQHAEEREYVLKAIEFVSEYGWLFLPAYTYNAETAEWMHWREQDFIMKHYIEGIDYSWGKMHYEHTNVFIKWNPDEFDSLFIAAKDTLIQ